MRSRPTRRSASPAGRPFAILASVPVILGIVTGVAHWLFDARLRRGPPDPVG